MYSIKSEKNKSKMFNELIEENKLKFYKTAKTILKNDDDVYDALQEALISIYNNLENLKNKKYFTTWSIRIVINKCYDILRKNKNNISLDTEEFKDTLSEYDSYNVDQYGLTKALSYLDKDLRLIVTLYYYDDLKVKEISKITDTPEGTIKTKLAKARKILKDKLGKEEI